MSSELDIVLAGAEDDIVLQIQRELLSKPGGDLRDPAWIPYAAARRAQLETERLIPRWLAAGATDAAELGASAFESEVKLKVEPILQDLADRAARTSFSDWKTQQIRLMTVVFAIFFVVVGGLGHAMIAGSLTLPESVAEYLRNGNRVQWLKQCADGQFKQINGRAACNFVVWMEPPSQPYAYGPLADYAAIAAIFPTWLQWAVAWVLGLIALALLAVPILPAVSARAPFWLRAGSVLAGIVLGGWLWSVVHPWF